MSYITSNDKFSLQNVIKYYNIAYYYVHTIIIIIYKSYITKLTSGNIFYKILLSYKLKLSVS